MDRKIISCRIADIQNNLSRLNNNICAMDSLDIQRYPENYETMSTEAALRAEGIACQLRSLLFVTQVFAGLFVQLRFRVADDQGFPAGYPL